MSRADTPLIKTVDSDTAEDFLQALQVHDQKHFQPYSSWIFRGQANADWKLTPSARRPGPRTHAGKKVMLPVLLTWVPGQVGGYELTPADTMELEHGLVIEYAVIVDRAGFELPGDTPEFRDPDAEPVPPSLVKFPPVHLRSMFALAQHYGIPTRLLDWTLRPMIAAYFATVGVARELTEGTFDGGKRLAVWALNETALVAIRTWDPGAIIVTAPTVSNPNLQAQSALFTLVRFLDEEKAASEHVPDLDNLFVSKTGRDLPVGSQHLAPVLIKFTLPVSEARSLLYMLSLHGITAATVYPNLGGAADARREQNWHQIASPGSRS